MADSATPAAGASDPSDPAGFVAVCPPLAQVRHIAAINQAIRAADPVALHKALEANEDASPVIPPILKNRRLFVSPIKAAPGMYRVNGIGTTLWTSEKGADRLAIGTLWLTVLFLPLFPIAQYLVEDTGGNNYRFYGKVPLGGIVKLWRRSFALALVLGAVGVAGSIWFAGSASTVHVFNGLDFAVSVEVDGKSLALAPASRQTVDVKTGAQKIVVKGLLGAAIAEENVEIPKYKDFIGYNVLGAAPVYAEGIVYSTSPTNPEDNPVTIYVGQTLFENDDISYVFEDPPEEITIPEGASSATKWSLDVLDGGLLASTMLLHRFERGADALQLARKLSDVSPAESSAHPIAYNLLLDAGKKDEAQLLVHKLTERYPNAEGLAVLTKVAKDGSYFEFPDEEDEAEEPE